VDHILSRVISTNSPQIEIDFEDEVQEAVISFIPVKSGSSRRVITHKIDSANIRHNQVIKDRKNRIPNFVALNAMVKEFETHSSATLPTSLPMKLQPRSLSLITVCKRIALLNIKSIN
jgi:hypothetical protein